MAEIQPGQTGKITVTVNTAGRPGRLSKSVEVWTNDPVNKMTMLTIAGEVVAAAPPAGGQSGGGK